MTEKKADRRTLKTQKAICDALAELLTKKELRRITVQEIADKAEINRVTFYKHYLDVYDLYDKIEEATLVELGLITLSIEERSAGQFFAELCSYISENRRIFSMVFNPNAAGQFRSKLSKLIEGLFQQIQSENLGLDIGDTELAYVSCYRAQGCLEVISKWVNGGFAEPAKLIAETVSALDEQVKRTFACKRK